MQLWVVDRALTPVIRIAIRFGFDSLNLDPDAIPAVLVAGHAPFCWGKDAHEATHNAVVVEYVAKMAYRSLGINPGAKPLPGELHDKHFLRKHGKTAYYGQVSPK